MRYFFISFEDETIDKCGHSYKESFAHPYQVSLYQASIAKFNYSLAIVDGQEISSIGPGLCVLVGIHVEDTQTDMEYM